jgi:hypothetical protein
VERPAPVDNCQEAALAVLELLEPLLDELLLDSVDFAGAGSFLLESDLLESDFDESLELDSLLVEVARLSLR